MQRRIKLPPLGEGVEVATVLEWAYAVGDAVEAGSPLVTMALDKVDADVPCPVDGVLTELCATEGDEVAVGDVLCIVRQ